MVIEASFNCQQRMRYYLQIDLPRVLSNLSIYDIIQRNYLDINSYEGELTFNYFLSSKEFCSIIMYHHRMQETTSTYTEIINQKNESSKIGL